MIIAFLRHIQGYGKNHYCGYVGVKDSSMLPRSFQDSTFEDIENDPEYDYLDNSIRVHGGITFDGVFPQETSIIPLTDIPEDWHTYHVYGFDLNHNDDNETGISTNFDYAKNEALSMKQQIEELIQSLKNEE